MEKRVYYLVSVGLSATWATNQFTYHSDKTLNIGEIVSVPFGNSSKAGFVVKQTTKPNVKTKEINRLSGNPVLPDSSIKLIDWLNSNYPNMPGLHTQYVIPSLTLKIKDKDYRLEKKNDYNFSTLPKLTATQKSTVDILKKSVKPQILHGITGSGKTRIYQELAKETIEDGKNVLIIYPEISLTTHIKKAFEDVVGHSNLHLYHSKNSPINQKQTWISAATKKSGQVFIGPRSALFLPINNLGLLVVDEAHDSSLKQDSGSRYNGLMVAGAIAKINGVKLIFGSATPPLQETNYILNSGGALVCMHDLAKAESRRNFEIIDMTDKTNLSSVSHLLSKKLLTNIEESLKNGRQSLLFLNRRGTARSLICESCGWHATCSRCDNPLTYHHDNHKLICHICGYGRNSPVSCQDCSSHLKLKSPGTKAIESDLKKLFPSAKIMRFDSDNNKADSMLENYKKIRDGGADILIGTQLITKGLDLPNLETVGILQADSSLFLPDFSSQERTFQLLTQVSGRAGRGHGDGNVFVQTYNPENKILQLVVDQDWHKFYETELEVRKRSNFPPFSYMARVWINKNSENAAINASNKIIIDFKSVKVLGPAPSFYGKKAGKYSWQILLFSNSRQKLAELMKSLPKDTFYDLDPVSLL